jgi:hypothetical protein
MEEMLKQIETAREREKLREAEMARREEAQRKLREELTEAGRTIAGVMSRVESAARGESVS